MDESVEGPPAGHHDEAAQRPQIGVPVEPPYEGVGRGEIQDEGADVCAPQGREGVSGSAVPPVARQVVQERLVVQLLQDHPKVGALRLRIRGRYGMVVTCHAGESPHSIESLAALKG